MASHVLRLMMILTAAAVAAPSIEPARAEPSAACNAGSVQTLTGVVTMAPAKVKSVGWMIVAPTIDDSNVCRVMDFVGKDPFPADCAENMHFEAFGTVDADAYALQVKSIKCR